MPLNEHQLESLSPRPTRRRYRGPVTIALGYGVFGVLWIVLSDIVAVRLAGDLAQAAQFQTVKGIAFVLASSVLVYWLAALATRRIAEQHETEKRQLSDAVVQATLAGISEAVMIVDPGSRTIVGSNPAAERMFGFGAGELDWKSTEILHLDREHFEEFALLSEAVLDAGQPFRARYRMRHRDGAIIETDHTVSAIDPASGWRAGVASVVRDVTEEVRVVEALARREEQYRLLADQSLDVIWSMDLDLRFTYVSPAIKTQVGLTPEEVIGGSLADLVEPDELERLSALIRHLAVQTEEGPEGVLVETRMIRRDGSTLPVEVHGFIQRDEHANPTAIQGTTRDISQRLESATHLREMVRRLRALGRIDQAINSMTPPGLLLDLVAKEARDATGFPASAVLRLIEPEHRLRPVAATGFLGDLAGTVVMLPDEGLIGRVVMSRRSLTVPDVQAVGSGFARHEIALAEGLHGFAAAPMVAHGQVVGAVAVFSRTKETLPDDRLEFLEMLAGQAAIGISHADSFLELQRSNEQLLLAYDASIAGWSRALDLRDHETQGHSRRVTDITVALARRAGIEGIDLRYIRWGALLHDIGKMGVPDQILRKPSPLTPEEWDIVRQHPVIARDLLRPIKYLEPALAIPHAHHERWDGSGYPDGLSGEAIPFAARLFAVVDVFDAMRSSRPYRVGLEESMVLEHLRSQAGIQLDPELVELFCTAMPEIPECRDPAYDSG